MVIRRMGIAQASSDAVVNQQAIVRLDHGPSISCVVRLGDAGEDIRIPGWRAEQ